ncbi:MAG: hypothetical protein ABI409_09140, partial [Ramlibacter sp.]
MTLVLAGSVLAAVMSLELESSAGSTVALVGSIGDRHPIPLLRLIHRHLHHGSHRVHALFRSRGLRMMRTVVDGCHG